MHVNRKFDRFKQWAGERMGGEVKTGLTDDFKAMEEEMSHRHEGMERLHRSMNGYVKSISKTKEGDDKDRCLPIGHLGTVMIGHGEDFESDSEFGSCLVAMGRSNEALARIQDRYIAKATSSWLEPLERSLAQMKEYTAARKKLDARRLAYDASLSKMQKAKREDFRVEEELRAQKAKFEESTEDVFRRMQDIQEAEAESVADMGAFLEAELEYHDRCRDVLLKLKRDWPASQGLTANGDHRRGSGDPHRGGRTAGVAYDDAPSSATLEPRPSIRSVKIPPHALDSRPDAATSSQTSLPARRLGRQASMPYGHVQGQPGFQPGRAVRTPSDPVHLSTRPFPPRRVNGAEADERAWVDPSDDSAVSLSSPERSCEDLFESPTTSHGSVASVYLSAVRPSGAAPRGKKTVPPPPPPSRATKPPPPPPPPAKRSGLATASVMYGGT